MGEDRGPVEKRVSEVENRPRKLQEGKTGRKEVTV